MNYIDALLEFGKFVGYPLVVMVTIIGVRFLIYFHSFFFHWPRYRRMDKVTLREIQALPQLPFIKVHVTTRGAPGSTEVIRRGIQNVVTLAQEAPGLYGPKLSVEVVTESAEQKHVLEKEFSQSPIQVQAIVLPPPTEYETPKGTKMKARSLHYMTELRRQGFNRKCGKTFVVHYDEESVMEPDELRRLICYLATTDKKLTEGPIHYPLEYQEASGICLVMEAMRPVGCFECRSVMENGTPLHLHGSNLVIDEGLENELGWDIGTLDGQPFIAEDYVFGVRAYLRKGPQVFGWHGCVLLEQPPFSVKSAFRQRFRWITGVLQGMAMMQQVPEFHHLSKRIRFRLVWGTRFRVMTFALGLPTGALSLLYLLYQAGLVLSGHNVLPLPLPIMVWLILVGFLWLNALFIGAWYNLARAQQLSVCQRWIEVARVLALAPIGGLVECAAGFWAVMRWVTGQHQVSAWHPTPKTKQADKIMNWRKAHEESPITSGVYIRRGNDLHALSTHSLNDSGEHDTTILVDRVVDSVLHSDAG